jgi:hypothetical protein
MVVIEWFLFYGVHRDRDALLIVDGKKLASGIEP